MTRKIYQTVIGIFCIFWIIKNIIFPAFALAYYHNTYLELSSKCANAMDESWFLEQAGSADLNRTAEIHLLVCHEYDKTRKIMLSLGLSENVLSYIGLNALELNQRPATELIEQHRFQQR